MHNLKSSLANLPKPTKIILFFASLIILLTIIFLLIPRSPESTHIHIDDFSSVTSAPDDYRKLIEETIWNTINTQPGVSKNDLASATIRQDSTTESVDQNLVTTSFLVDLESLHYSFRVTFSWNNQQKRVPTDATISVTCPTATEIIYDDFVCPIDASLAVRNFLPHEEFLKDGTQINITLDRYQSYQNHAGESFLAVSLPTCQNYDQLIEAKNLTDQWLTSLHLDYSSLRIEVSCSQCPLNTTSTDIDRCHFYSNPTENSDLLNLLPHADTNFKIEPLTSSDKKIHIILFLDRSSPDYPDHIDEARSRYLNEALSWIKSRGFNPQNYPYETTLEYL